MLVKNEIASSAVVVRIPEDGILMNLISKGRYPTWAERSPTELNSLSYCLLHSSMTLMASSSVFTMIGSPLCSMMSPQYGCPYSPDILSVL